MKSFKTYITELFDTPINFTTSQTDINFIYRFTTKKDNDVVITFWYENYNKKAVHITFSVNERIEHKDLKDLQVFSGVIQAIKDYVNKNEPEKIFFDAVEKEKIPLYNRFADILQKNGYKKIPTDRDFMFAFKRS